MFGHENQDNTKRDGQDEPADNFGSSDDNADQNAPADKPSDDASADLVQTPAPHVDAASTDDLLDIKHKALEALSPLVGQLEQSPEEKFRTTMMMIQASDNHALVKVAYEAAKGIANEKERAQALLDIVNEINYFTQSHAA